jgi:tetratricopeptide (TPR) repeat protein
MRWLLFKSGKQVVLLLLPVIIIGLSGCAGHRKGSLMNQGEIFSGSEYKKVLERQKERAAAAAGEDEQVTETTAEGYEWLGDRYTREGRLGMAFVQYRRALQIEPARTGLRCKIGFLFLEKGLHDDALEVFEEVLKDDPNNALAYEGKGRIMLAGENLDKSEECFTMALRYNPKLWRAHNFLGLTYDRRLKFEAAIAEYQKAIALRPNSSILLSNLGMSYYLHGEYEKSIETLLKALEIKPVSPKTYNNLGLALSRLKRYGEAFEAFKKGQGEAAAYNNLGCIYMTIGQFEKAAQSFEKAIQVGPEFYAQAHNNLKTAYHNIGCRYLFNRQYEKAIQIFDKALKMNHHLYPNS